ncbi:MAG: NAD-dependent epimerase/dehydratase family protein [Gemmatimonadota bacterium]|nr:MAG: NAD-dependent epimerase/dehydratase family protein [Gemmatimonadota bacterium]
MSTTRRDFIRSTAAAAGALGLAGLQARPAEARPAPAAGKPLRLLILGGTTYLGPYQIRHALERGHEVTIFNRGKTTPILFPEVFARVERLTGDRNDNLEALEGREWDAVIDNSATDPKWVRESARVLKDSVGYYMFTSSTGVYYPYLTTNIDETTEVVTEWDPETGPGGRYGVDKSLSEIEARQAFPDRAIIVRPHYIIGPGDPKDRLTYWVARIDLGGDVLAPGDPDDPVQLIDVRDLTEWMIRMVEEGNAGTYNATGPRSRLSSAGLVYGIRAITSSAISFTWVGTDFLLEHGLPYMVPWVAPRGDSLGMSTISADRAIAAGLTYRPLAVTARENLEWWREQSEERRAALGSLPTQKEREILSAWAERTG